jgi:hypothetical protein
MLSVTQEDDGLVIIDARGRVTAADYQQFVTGLREVAERGESHRALIRVLDFEGIAAGAMWQEMKAGSHYKDLFDRIAVIGRGSSDSWLTSITKPFVGAEVRYFTEDQAPGAVGWIREPSPAEETSLRDDDESAD